MATFLSETKKYKIGHRHKHAVTAALICGEAVHMNDMFAPVGA